MQYESKYEKITIQYKRANRANEDWQELSKSAIQTNISPDTTEVEANDLTIDKVYNFRGLFEDKTTGELDLEVQLVQLNRCDGVYSNY